MHHEYVYAYFSTSTSLQLGLGRKVRERFSFGGPVSCDDDGLQTGYHIRSMPGRQSNDVHMFETAVQMFEWAVLLHRRLDVSRYIFCTCIFRHFRILFLLPIFNRHVESVSILLSLSMIIQRVKITSVEIRGNNFWNSKKTCFKSKILDFWSVFSCVYNSS